MTNVSFNENDPFDELVKRWENAFDEIAQLEHYKHQVKTTKYATSPCFDLKEYTMEQFPPGKELFDTDLSKVSLLNYTYGLQPDGLPCYMALGSETNQNYYAGFFSYTPELVEAIEFNLGTRIPCRIQRMTFEKGRKTSFQEISIHSQASAPVYRSLSKEGIIESIKKDKYAIQASVQQFSYDQDKIGTVYCARRTSGGRTKQFKSKYIYDEHNDLKEIRNFYPNESSRLSYSRPEENFDIQILADQLAKTIAESIVDILLKNDVEYPIAIVEMSYRYCDTYLPYIISKSASVRSEAVQQEREVIFDWLFVGQGGLLFLDDTEFESPFQQFMQYIQEKEAPDMGRTMLRKAASLLTTSKLFGKIPVADEFVAYAIDWSIEGHETEDFQNILQECGLENKVIEAWKDRGWFRP